VSVADPVLSCVGALRGFPGPRSAAALAAVSYQPGGAGRPFIGPLDRVVDAVMAGIRLEGWALWCELSAIADLVTAWSAHPPLDPAEDPHGSGDGSGQPRELREVDPALAARLTRVDAAVDRGHRGVHGDPVADAMVFASSELSASCGISRSRADKRIRAARVLLVEQRLPRVAMLLRAGLLDRDKTELLVSRLGELEPLTAECVEERLIPDHDVPVLPDLPHAPDLTDSDPLDPATDRVMICGSMAMLQDHKTICEDLGFTEGSNSEPGQFVIEKAFVD